MTYKEFKKLKSLVTASAMDKEGIDSAIYTVSKATNVKDVVEITGLGPAEFSKEFGLPLRTLEDWKAGRRTPSEWGFSCLLYLVYNYIMEEKKEHWDIMINEEMLGKDFASLEEAIKQAKYLHEKSENAVIWVIELEEAKDGEETYMGFKKIYDLY